MVLDVAAVVVVGLLIALYMETRRGRRALEILAGAGRLLGQRAFFTRSEPGAPEAERARPAHRPPQPVEPRAPTWQRRPHPLDDVEPQRVTPDHRRTVADFHARHPGADAGSGLPHLQAGAQGAPSSPLARTAPNVPAVASDAGEDDEDTVARAKPRR